MSVIEYIVGGILVVMSLIVIAVVLLQQGREANLGSISGGADSFMESGKARTLDAILERYTKLIAVVFFILVFVGMLVSHFVTK